MKKIKAVVFDLGRVLIDFDHNIAAKKILKHTGKTQQEIYDFFFDSPLTALFEEGKISGVDFFKEVKKKLGLRLSYKEFLPIWNDIFIFTGQNQRIYALAKKLKKKYKVSLLSNINALHFAYLKNKFPVFDVFDNLFLSYQIKAKKPDPALYRSVIRRLGVEPEEIFYTDDRQDLIEASRKLKIRGFVFKNPGQLRKDLEKAGIFLKTLDKKR